LLSPSGAIDDCIRSNYEYTGRIERLPFWIEEPDGAGLPTPGIKAFDFIYLGRRDPEKGLSELVAAVSLLVPERPGLKVLIAGPGKAHEYQAQAEDLGVSSHIEFRFLATEAETRTALAQSRFLVLPSYHEGFPLVLLEAGQLGIPFIATDVGSIPEMVGRSNAGFLIRPGDAAGLGKAMSAALNETAPVYAERKKAAEEMFHKLSSPIRVRRTLLSVLRQCADAST
jgi:glycosyltransferase involved in cell wall biosynthesis